MLYLGHAPRIKFKASKEQRNTREYSTMLIDDPNQIENMPKRSFLKAKELEIIKDFVINNREALLKLANKEIDYKNDFLPNMIKPE